MTQHRLLALAAAMAGATLLTACGGGSDPATNTAASSTSPSAAPSGAPGGQGSVTQGRRPGASGLIADISGQTLQVQSQQTGQVAVTWTGDTVFTRTVSASAKDVKVGDCVVVRSDAANGSTTSEVTASTISVAAPVDGSCQGQGGFGGFGGGGPGGGAFGGARPSGAPSGFPSGAPSGAPGGGRGGGFTPPTSGTVTAVGNGTLTVDAVSFALPGAGQNATPDPNASPTTTSVTVHTTGDTTWTTTADGSAKQLKVGECATAIGAADDTGAVTATSIITRPATDGSCDNGFGGGPLSQGSSQ